MGTLFENECSLSIIGCGDTQPLLVEKITFCHSRVGESKSFGYKPSCKGTSYLVKLSLPNIYSK